MHYLFGKWSHSLVENIAPMTELKKCNLLKPASSAEEAGNFEANFVSGLANFYTQA